MSGGLRCEIVPLVASGRRGAGPSVRVHPSTYPSDGINGLAWSRTYAGAMRHPFFRGVSSQLAGASVLRSAPAIFGRAG